MAKFKESREKQESTEDVEINKGQTSEDASANTAENDSASLREQLADKEQKCSEYLNMLQRTAAEFDNFKKRTAKEKEAIYNDGVSDTVSAFLPLIDSMERAEKSFSESEDKSLKEGFDLIMRQMREALSKNGVKEIKSVGEQFDPELHNAVMHIDDEAFGTNEIVEEFQKGYILEEKVVRHSMDKVAN
jgi:molecular chaperone GrpE